MILSVQRHVHDAIADGDPARHFGVADVPPFAVEVPPTRALGDLAVPVAFQLARALRKAPRAIAQELARRSAPIPGVARVVAAPNGYLNLFLDRPAFFLAARSASEVPPAARAAREDDRRAHGDQPEQGGAHRPPAQRRARRHARPRAALPRHAGRGRRTTSTTPASRSPTSSSASASSSSKTLADVRHIADTTRFDYYCWDLYSRVTEWYDGDKARLAIRAAALHDLEHGGNDTAAIGAFIVDRIVRAHLKTMARLNIGYDLLTYEGDILRLQFWAHAFEILKAQGAVFLQTEGKLAGCWVMPIDDDAGRRPRTSADDGRRRRGRAREKVIVRSNGVVTYVGKDIANQFWKFGLLGRDFHYRPLRDAGRRPAAVVDDVRRRRRRARRRSASARRIYNVIDSRQMYLQALLSQALRTLGHPRRGRELDPLLVRDGGAVARDGARARLPAAEARTRRSRSSRCRDARASA